LKSQPFIYCEEVYGLNHNLSFIVEEKNDNSPLLLQQKNKYYHCILNGMKVATYYTIVFPRDHITK
jgi:hypothetical protein